MPLTTATTWPRFAKGLRRRGFEVFYDQHYQADLLGQNLLTYLQEVYSHRSAMVAAFISEQWVTDPWPSHERESALAHALLNAPEDVPFVLPFRFDDTPVPGLQPTVAYEDLRELGPRERRWRQGSRYKKPLHVIERLVDVLEQRGIAPSSPADTDLEEGLAWRIRLAWVAGETGYSAHGGVPPEEVEEGETEVFPDEEEPDGPVTGRYLLLPENLWTPVDPNDPLPTFLHEDYQAYEKTWVESLDDPDAEAATADHAKQQLQALVSSELQQGSVALAPTFTQGSQSAQGPVIRATCVLARPAC